MKVAWTHDIPSHSGYYWLKWFPSSPKIVYADVEKKYAIIHTQHYNLDNLGRDQFTMWSQEEITCEDA